MPDKELSDDLNERACAVLEHAFEAAQQQQQLYVGTEHLLLALLQEGESDAAQLLISSGLTYDKAQSSIERMMGTGNARGTYPLDITPRCKLCILRGVNEAQRLHHYPVDVEHLLLGLLPEREGVTVFVFESHGIDADQIRTQLLERLQARRAVPPVLPGKEQLPMSDKGRFDKFSGATKKVLTHAQEEAQRLQHNYIGTEHLLLGLVREGDGVAAQVLKQMHITLTKVRKSVEHIIGRGERIALGEIGLTPRAKKVIELAIDEAQRLNQQQVETEHLLLGLVREGDGIAVGILESMGAEREVVRTRTLQALHQTPPNALATHQQTPTIPPEAAELITAGQPSLHCSNCGAASPAYFRYCFHCGDRLTPEP